MLESQTGFGPGFGFCPVICSRRSPGLGAAAQQGPRKSQLRAIVASGPRDEGPGIPQKHGPWPILHPQAAGLATLRKKMIAH